MVRLPPDIPSHPARRVARMGPDAGAAAVSLLRRRLLAAGCAWPLAGIGAHAARAQAPSTPGALPFRDETWHDASRKRDVPVRIRSRGAASGAPLLLFSHGLGGSVAGGAQWVDHWARAGYVVVNVQHPGSDESIWRHDGRTVRNAGSREDIVERMRRAANPETFLHRIFDIRFVIDEALALRARGDTTFAGIDPANIGMSGHSYGAVTTQAICGERFAGRSLADPRVKAGIAFSPSPARGDDAQAAFAGVKMPMLLVTGTQDGDVLGNGATPELRRGAFDALPAGHKFLLVLDGATHMTFSGGEHPNAGGEGPHFREAVQAVTLAFWDAELRGDAAMRAWLAAGARSALAAGDAFEGG